MEEVHTIAFSGEVDSRFAVENASTQEARARFRFRKNANRSRQGGGDASKEETQPWLIRN
jgi:hypothetical protein